VTEDDAAPVLRLGGLRLSVSGVAEAAAHEDWIHALARVEAPGAVVEARGHFLTLAELKRLYDALVRMQRELRGSATLDAMEAMLRVTLTCGSRGDIALTVEISPDPATQAHRFDFALDQTALAPAVAALRRMLSAA
jgi:hypothetical protein